MTEAQRLKGFGQCKECNEINTSDNLCRTCNVDHFQKDFFKWTSGNKEIDYFIQNTQIHAWDYRLILEWYPWETISGVEEIGKGGFGTVFRAKRKIGRICNWDRHNHEWNRVQKGDWEYNDYVALKTIGHCESL